MPFVHSSSFLNQIHKLSKKAGRGQPGFTLVELLVVIAIIALLAAILFPAFSRSRENARRSKCETQIRFLSLGIRQYNQDFDETFPLTTVNMTPSATLTYGWADAILPYVTSYNIYQCPSESTPPPTGVSADGSYWDQQGATDYGYNGLLQNVPEAKIASACSVVELSETQSSVAGSGYGNYSYSGLNDANPSPATADNTRHAGGANYAFVDGHVKWLMPQQVYDNQASFNNVSFLYGLG